MRCGPVRDHLRVWRVAVHTIEDSLYFTALLDRSPRHETGHFENASTISRSRVSLSLCPWPAATRTHATGSAASGSAAAGATTAGSAAAGSTAAASSPPSSPGAPPCSPPASAAAA
eukprot:scaffold76316_cov52-Phaeocystis_antarctica.AAC.3